MKRIAIGFGILVFICAIVSGVAIYLSNHHQNKDEIILYGNVDVRLVDIGFRVPGQVDQVYFEEGDFVNKGTLIATLDTTPYDQQVQQAIANVDSVKANFENAEKLLRRRQELIGVGGVSQEDLDNAISNYEQLLGELHAVKAALAIARDNLSYTEAYAPTDGIILTRVREPGSVILASEPVYTLSIASPVWVRAFVTEPDLGQVYSGMTAEVFTDTPGGRSYTGKIGFISPMAEFTPKTVQTTELRTDLVYRLRIYVDNPDWGLKQGMPVTVKLHIKK